VRQISAKVAGHRLFLAPFGIYWCPCACIVAAAVIYQCKLHILLQRIELAAKSVYQCVKDVDVVDSSQQVAGAGGSRKDVDCSMQAHTQGRGKGEGKEELISLKE
jgi:hypothetical protein